MFKKSLTTIIIIIILVIASAIVTANDNAKVKEGAGCQGLANAMEASGNNPAVVAQYIAHGCAPTEPPKATETEPPATATEPPATETEPPATETEPPATETEPPATETEPPATETEPPATETEPPSGLDSDGDGFFDSMDCEPLKAEVYPGSPTGSCDNVVAFGTGALQITLVWDTASNLDLKVSEPSGELIYWANMDSHSGGILEYDAQCNALLYAENIYWGNTAPSGDYVLHVVEADACGNSVPANWILTIREDGNIVEQYQGTGDAMIPFSY